MSGKMIKSLVAIAFCMNLAVAAYADEAVIYVDGAATGANDGSSWSDAYVSLEDALTAAAEADTAREIRVAQGTYTSRGPRGFRPSGGVTLQGGYAGTAGTDPNDRDIVDYATVLTGDPALAVRDIASSVIVSGFTITYGPIDTGAYIQDASATFVDCRFLSDGILTHGIDAWDGSCVLIRCQFEGNSGWGISCYDGHLTLTDCTFAQTQQGAIDGLGTVDMLRCCFVDNGRAVLWSGTLTARHCTFADNHAESAALVSCSGDSTLSDCHFIHNRSTAGASGALMVSGGNATLTRCQFLGNSNTAWASGAIWSYSSVMELRHCLFAGNAGGAIGKTQHNPAGVKGPGAIHHSGPILRISNCTFVDNRGEPNSIMHSPSYGIAEINQSILWDGTEPFWPVTDAGPQIAVTYSNVLGGCPGKGNTAIDPGFVAPGYWDTNGTPDDPNDDVYVVGDYHLKSQAGHWDQDIEDWVLDEITSPCIDLGDPNGPLGSEPFPNGGFVNLGAYGGTGQASRSYFGTPVCEPQIAGDINGDCQVDDLDLDILTSHWLMDATEPANIPPTIRIISPEDGAILTPPTPIVFRVEASDPDGTIVQVEYRLACDRGNTHWGTSRTLGDPTDGWAFEYDWEYVRYDGVHTVYAEAIDDSGERVVSPTISFTLRPSD